MTDSILRSYQYYSTTTIIPYPETVPIVGADLLLSGETDGFAVDAITYSSITDEAYEGGIVGGTVSVTSPALSNVAMDASNLTNGSTSPKKVFFPTSPYVRYAPHNLLINSGDFANATYWGDTPGSAATTHVLSGTAPDGTATSYLLGGSVAGNTTRGVYNIPNTTATNYEVYTISGYFKKNTTNWGKILFTDAATGSIGTWFNVDTGVLGTVDDFGGGTVSSRTITAVPGATGWYRVSVTGYFVSGGSNRFLMAGQTSVDASDNSIATDDILVWGLQRVKGTLPLPYLATTTAARYGIPQTYDSVESKYAVWSEPAATNLCQQSDEPGESTAWTSGGITGGTGVDSDVGMYGLMTCSATNASHYIQSGTLFANASPCTFSMLVKPSGSGSRYFTLNMNDSGTGTHYAYAVYDCSGAGAVTQTGDDATGITYVSSSIKLLGNDWYRIALTANSAHAGGFFRCAIAHSNSATPGGPGPVFTATGTESARLTCAQHENTSIATSPIVNPRSAGTATRAADLISALDSTFPGSDTNISVYLDYKPLLVTSGTRYGWAYWKDSSNFMSLYGSTANPTMGNKQGGTDDVTTDLGTLVAGTRTQVTIACKANDFDGSQDGAAPTDDPSSTLTTGYTTLYLGAFGTTGSELNGYIYRMVFVPYQRETVNGDLETWRYDP